MQVERGGEPKRRLKPRHVVLCTGRMRFLVTRAGLYLTESLQRRSGEPRVPVFPVRNNFEGTISKSASIKTLRFPVIYPAKRLSSIAQASYATKGIGADVILVQNRGISVISAKPGLFILPEGLYEGGPPTEDANG